MLTLAACSPAPPEVHAVPEADQDWPFYGGDAGGQRYSQPPPRSRPPNVRALKVAWTYSTGDATTKAADIKRAAFENTPILAGGRLYICSPFNAVSPLDPATGKPFWRFDPKIDSDGALSQRLSPAAGVDLLARPGRRAPARPAPSASSWPRSTAG